VRNLLIAAQSALCIRELPPWTRERQSNQVDLLAAAIIQLHDSLHLLVNNLSNTESNASSAKLARRMQASRTAVARTISKSVRRVAKVTSGHEINGKKRSRNARALLSPRRFPPASCPPGAATARQRVVPRRVRNASSPLMTRHRRGKGEASGAANARRRTERVVLQDKTHTRVTRRSQCGEPSLRQRCIIGEFIQFTKQIHDETLQCQAGRTESLNQHEQEVFAVEERPDEAVESLDGVGVVLCALQAKSLWRAHLSVEKGSTAMSEGYAHALPTQPLTQYDHRSIAIA
jgi:hypothetical protein